MRSEQETYGLIMDIAKADEYQGYLNTYFDGNVEKAWKWYNYDKNITKIRSGCCHADMA